MRSRVVGPRRTSPCSTTSCLTEAAATPRESGVLFEDAYLFTKKLLEVLG